MTFPGLHTKPAETHLTVSTDHVIATSILLYGGLTLGETQFSFNVLLGENDHLRTGLGVGHHPVVGLALVLTLEAPEPQQTTGDRLVTLQPTGEAGGVASRAGDGELPALHRAADGVEAGEVRVVRRQVLHRAVN